jgi:hypothetical protein
MGSIDKQHEAAMREVARKREEDRGVLTRRLRGIEEKRPEWFREPSPAECSRCRDTRYVYAETTDRAGNVLSAAKPCPSCPEGRAIRARSRGDASDGPKGTTQKELDGMSPVRDYKQAQGNDE